MSIIFYDIPISNELKRDIINVLKATFFENLFPDWEFQTLIGFEKHEIKLIIDSIPVIDYCLSDFLQIVFSCAVNLNGYPHGMENLLITKYNLSSSRIDFLCNEINKEIL